MLTQPRTWDPNWSLAEDICFFKQNKILKNLWNQKARCSGEWYIG